MKCFITAAQVIKTDLVFLLSVSGSLVFHLFIAWQPVQTLEGFPLVYGNGPLFDDSYFYFTIARDIADWLSGRAAALALSSGFNPLIAFLYTPVFYLYGNQLELSIHLCLTLNVFIAFAAHIFLYRLLCRVSSRSIAAFFASVWIWSPYVMNQVLNGMETTLSFFMLVFTLYYYWTIKQNDTKEPRFWLSIGLLLGVGFWARVDLAILGIAIACDQAWLAIKDLRHEGFLRMRNILICSTTAVAVASPWLFFTYTQTGSIMPVSGKAVNQITSIFFNFTHPNHDGFFSMMFYYFKKEFFVYLPLAQILDNLLWLIFISVLYLAGLFCVIRDRQLRSTCGVVLLFQLIIIIAYLNVIGGFWHLYRYFYPVYALLLLLPAITFQRVMSKFKVTRRVSTVLCVILFVPYAFYFANQYYGQFTKLFPPRYFSAYSFVSDVIPHNSKIGAFQSGCLSYWLGSRVVNLDGVINEEVYVHLKNKTLEDYLDKKNIDYIIEEIYLFNMWNHFLKDQLSEHYSLISSRKVESLPFSMGLWGIYKRTS